MTHTNKFDKTGEKSDMKKMKILLGMLLVSAVLLTGCQKNGNESDDGQNKNETAKNQEDTKKSESTGDGELLSGKHHVEIVIQDKGTIKVELDADSAPITVTNFVNLAKDGFYDGLTFHRIIEGFMMQGGDPDGNGMGGSANTIKGEFDANGVENPLSHTRGAISMARSQANDSASSQFFIVHQDSQFLDGKYAAFGYVTEGIEIVDDICQNAQVIDNNGRVKDGTQPVMESVKVID